LSSPESQCFCHRSEFIKFLFLVQDSRRLYSGLARSRISVVQPTIHYDGRGVSNNPRERSRSALGSSRLDEQALVELNNGFDEQIPIFPRTKPARWGLPIGACEWFIYLDPLRASPCIIMKCPRLHPKSLKKGEKSNIRVTHVPEGHKKDIHLKIIVSLDKDGVRHVDE